MNVLEILGVAYICSFAVGLIVVAMVCGVDKHGDQEP